MKKAIVIIISLLVLFTALDARVRRARITVNTYDENNKILEGVEVTIETSIQIVTQFTNAHGVSKFKIKKTKHEIPLVSAKKRGYVPYTGRIERNAAGNIIIKLKKEKNQNEHSKNLFKFSKKRHFYAVYVVRPDPFRNRRVYRM